MLDVSRSPPGYGRTMIVRDVSIGMGRGEIVAIVGRNGVGKTTLMKAIIGLLPLARGADRIRRNRHHDSASQLTGAAGHGLLAAGARYLPGSDRRRESARWAS